MTLLIVLGMFVLFVAMDALSNRITLQMYQKKANSRTAGTKVTVISAAIIKSAMVDLPISLVAMFVSAIPILVGICLVLSFVLLRYYIQICYVLNRTGSRIALAGALGALLLFGIWWPLIKTLAHEFGEGGINHSELARRPPLSRAS